MNEQITKQFEFEHTSGTQTIEVRKWDVESGEPKPSMEPTGTDGDDGLYRWYVVEIDEIAYIQWQQLKPLFNGSYVNGPSLVNEKCRGIHIEAINFVELDSDVIAGICHWIYATHGNGKPAREGYVQARWDEIMHHLSQFMSPKYLFNM